MRLFYAVPLEDRARAEAAAVLDALAKTGADYKWVEPENLHLTLAFLGETPEDRLPDLKAALEKAVQGRSAFTLVFDRLGAFSSLEHPRVLWLGAGEGGKALEEIALKLTRQEEERPFAAHLTLGRQRSPRNLKRLKDVCAGVKVAIQSRVDRVELLRSRLSSKGPIYEVIAEARL